MKCSAPNCTRDVTQKGAKLCEVCRHQPSRFPLAQARTDIERHRRYKLLDRPPPSESIDRSRARSLERELPSSPLGKRKREDSKSDSDSDSEFLKKVVKRPRDQSPPPLKRSWSPDLTDLSRLSASSPVSLPLLFIPFEGNFNKRMIGGYHSTGNQQSSILETGKSFQLQHGKQRFDQGSMQSTFGSSAHWSGKSGDLQKMDLLSDGKKQFQQLLEDESLSAQDFYQMVVEDRLRQLRFNSNSSPEQGLPEVIVLSERLLQWPTELRVLGHRYTRQQVLGTANVQDMAAFVLSSVNCFIFTTLNRTSSHKGASFKETWLLVQKVARYPALSVACVHLSSKYTTVNTDNMSPILEELIAFARTHGIHAIVGDLNMNTYGVHGGSFPVSNDFVLEKKMALKTTFATSSGSGNSVYMGGMICDSRVSFRPTLTTFGNNAMAPWFASGKFANQVFSDHHSLYCRYAFHGDGPRGRPLPPPNESGGDCFFYALRRRLNLNEGVLTLRERIIDQITHTVTHEPNMAAARPILVQQPRSDSAVSRWCLTPTAYMAQMRQSGRWMDDSLLPFIAAALQRRFIIQYNGYHAVFEQDGTRHEGAGEAQAGQGDIFMYCEGNHFW